MEKAKYVTPAEKHLVDTIKLYLSRREKNADTAKILNIGAGKSIVIEKQILEAGHTFICDRADIDDYQMNHPFIRKVYNCSVENMKQLNTEEYDIVFANYLLEHVEKINNAVSEICRVMKSGGLFITSLPNPVSLESAFVRKTPLWFHELVRGKEGWKTYYAFENVEALCAMFDNCGCHTIDVAYWSSMRAYMKRFIILNQLSAMYDAVINSLQYKRLMNNVCIVIRKPM